MSDSNGGTGGGVSLMRLARPLIAARLVTAVVTLSIPLVLARVLALADYGTYKQLFLIALTIAAMVPFGVPQSLYYFVPRSDDRRVYFTMTLSFLAVVGTGAAVGLYELLPRIAGALGNPALLEYRLLLALYCGFTVSASPLELSMTAQGHTGRAAVIYLVWDTARAAALVVPAAMGLGLHAGMEALTALAAVRVAMTWTLLVGGTRGAPWNLDLLAAQLAYAAPFGLAMLLSVPQQYAHQYVVAASVTPALYAIYAAGCFDPPFADLLYTPTSEVLMVRLGALEKAGRRGEGGAAFHEAVAHLATFLLPGVVFLWAVAPEFIVAAFGRKFVASAEIFRIWLLAVPLAIFPVDAALRARNETRHLFLSYLVKALVSVPVVLLGVKTFGIRGGAGSYVFSELVGKSILASRLPRALADAGERVPLRTLVPGRALVHAAIGSSLAALAGYAVVRIVPAANPSGGALSALYRLVPLGLAAGAAGIVYLAFLWARGIVPTGRAASVLAGGAKSAPPGPPLAPAQPHPAAPALGHAAEPVGPLPDDRF